MTITQLLELILPTAEETMMTSYELVTWMVVLFLKTASILFVIWFIVNVIGLKITMGKQ